MVSRENTLPSIRNLVDSDIGALRRFTGVLDSISSEPQKYNEGKPDEKSSTKLSLNYKEIEVVEAIEPYHFPIFTVVLTESNRKKSRYGIFGTSLAAILDQQYSEEEKNPSNPEYVKPSNRMDLSDCVGRRMGLVMADGEDGRPSLHELFDGRAKDETHPKGQDMPTPAWEVYMVEGIGVAGEGGVTALDKAIELLNGRTLSEFNKLAQTNDLIRGDVELLQSVGMPLSAPTSFSHTMLTSKKFIKDKAGVYHKVEKAGVRIDVA